MWAVVLQVDRIVVDPAELLDTRLEAVLHRIVQRIVGIEIADALQVQVFGPLLDWTRIEVFIVGSRHG